MIDDEREMHMKNFRGAVYISDMIDVQRGKLWDSIHYAKGSIMTRHNSILFTNVGPASGKTRVHANLNIPQRLLAPESFSVEKIYFTFGRRCAQGDIFNVLENAAFCLYLGQKQFASSPLIALHAVNASPAPIRICAFCKSVYAGAIFCVGCGAREVQFVELCDEQGVTFAYDANRLVIANQIQFFVQFEMDSIVMKSDFSLWCHLEGWHARGVQ